MNRRFFLRGVASLPFIGAAAVLTAKPQQIADPDPYGDAWMRAARQAYAAEVARIPTEYTTKFDVVIDRRRYREMADACCGGRCKSCRALEGDGPWCGCCGAEMPGTQPDGDSYFTEACPTCDDFLRNQEVA